MTNDENNSPVEEAVVAEETPAKTDVVDKIEVDTDKIVNALLSKFDILLQDKVTTIEENLNKRIAKINVAIKDKVTEIKESKTNIENEDDSIFKFDISHLERRR